jgi:hypothetical protein
MEKFGSRINIQIRTTVKDIQNWLDLLQSPRGV